MFAIICIFLLVAAEVSSVAAKSKQSRVPGMSDVEVYDQLIHFFEMATSPQDAALVAAVRNSEMWTSMHAEFGGEGKK